MKTYYYSIRENDGDWKDQIQYSCEFDTWINFINFCYSLSYHFHAEVRACETKGYNNQGSYILNGDKTLIQIDNQ